MTESLSQEKKLEASGNFSPRSKKSG